MRRCLISWFLYLARRDRWVDRRPHPRAAFSSYLACSPSRALCYHFSSRRMCCLHRQIRALARLHA